MNLKKLIIGFFVLQISIASLQAAEVAQSEFSWASLIASQEASSSASVDITEESIREKNFVSFCKEIGKIDSPEAMIVNFLFATISQQITHKITSNAHAIYHDVINDLNEESIQLNCYDRYFTLPTMREFSKNKTQDRIFKLTMQLLEDISLIILHIQSTSKDVEAAIKDINDLLATFKEGIVACFPLLNRDYAELICLDIPIIKSLIESNKIILANLLLGYAQAFYNTSSLHDSRSQFAKQLSPYFLSHLAHASKNTVAFRQLSVNAKQANDKELEYIYVRYNDYAKRKKLAMQLIKDKKLHHPIISNFLKEYGINDMAFRTYQSDLKMILDALLENITLPGCQKLCSIAFGTTVSTALKVARKFGPTERYESEFASKVLLRDGHLRTGDIKRQSPSGSHMITEQSDSEAIDEEIDLTAISERKREYSFSDADRTVFFTEILYTNPRSVMQTMFDQGIVNAANGVLYSMLSARTQMDCSFKVSYRGVTGKRIAINPQNELQALIPFIQRLFTSLEISLVGEIYSDETHVYCVVERVKSKKMGSSYYPQELTKNEATFFSLLEKAFFSQPIAIHGCKGFGPNLIFNKKFDIARLIFKVTDENQVSRQIEMFVKPYVGCTDIACIVTAFEHFAAIEINKTESFPQALATLDRSSLYELASENFLKLNKCLKCAVYARIMQLLTERRRLDQCHVDVTDGSRYVGIVDIDLLQFYKILTGSKIHLKIPLLIKVSKEQIDIMLERIKNENLLSIDLEKYDVVPPTFKVISSLALKKIADGKIVQTDSFRQILPIALREALIKGRSLLSKKTSEEGKIQVIFRFDVGKYTHSNVGFLNYDRLMANLSPEYYTALSGLKK